MIQSVDPHQQKSALRAQARASRRLLYVARAGESLADMGDRLPVMPEGIVAGYWPMGHEIDPRPLLERLQAAGWRVALPEVVAKDYPLLFRHWRTGDESGLVAGPHGTRHPGPDAPVVEPDLVLVPLLAFDNRLYRLGYGGGYYDRTLESLRSRRQIKAIGLAFAGQQVDAVPHDDNDQRLDGVLTEKGLILPEV